MDAALLVKLPNKPGSLAAAAGVIGRANVNIRAVAGLPHGRDAEVRFLTDDAAAALAALTREGYTVRTQPVLALPVTNTPGELALVAERLARAKVNIDATYLAASLDGESITVVFEVADPIAAEAALANAAPLLAP